MAINYYGTCIGAESSKYDLWLNVNQNSQDSAKNKSNITVLFYLKRNDENNDSAYNEEAVNDVKITIGGALLVEKKIPIDTRDGAIVKLATWNGNVTHERDGSLNLPIEATFSIVGDNGISGGSVSANFKCTLIGKKSSLVFTENTITPGITFECEISSVSDSYSHIVTWDLAEETYEDFYDCGVKNVSYTVPVSWLYQQTNTNSGIIFITIATYNGDVLIGSQRYSLNFVVPPYQAFSPEFSIGFAKINRKVPASWDVFVKGVSGVKVSAEDIQFKYGAGEGMVSVSVGGVTKNTLPAEFEITDSGNIPVSVTITDSRGLSTTHTEEIYAYEYEPPSIEVTSIKRCDSSGNDDPYGTYVLVEYNEKYSDIAGKNKCTIQAWFKQSGSNVFVDGTQIFESPAIIGDGTVSIGHSYTIRIQVHDSITTSPVEVRRYITSSNIPFNIRRGGKGASFGKFAEKENILDVAWNANIDGDGSFGGKIKVNEDASVGGACSVTGGVTIGGNCEIDGSVTGKGDGLFAGVLTGHLQFEDVETDMLSKINEIVSDIRYYPALDIVFVKLRLTVSQSIPAGTKTFLAEIKDRVPTFFTPVNCFVNGEGTILCKSGIFGGTGQISVEPTATIPVGRYIYINGVYVPDY